MRKFPHYKQYDGKDCGPTCLKIIAKHYDKSISLSSLREFSETWLFRSDRATLFGSNGATLKDVTSI